MIKDQCPNKEVCGSCGWSHIPYEKQLQQKLSDINGSFRLKELTLTCDKIIPSPITSHYRNRMDFVINFKGEVGLREKGKWWKVIDNHTCFISDKLIEEKFKIVRDWAQSSGLTYFDRKAHTGFLRYAVIRTSTLGQCMVIIVTSRPEESESIAIEAAFSKLSQSISATSLVCSLIWSINSTVTDVSSGDDLRCIAGESHIEEKINGFTYRIKPNSFFQTNSHAAAVLQNHVAEYVSNLTPEILLDLYCGSGFFSIALSGKAKKTYGVEIMPEMIEDARVNAKINNLDIDYSASKAESSDWKNLNADLIILDPPRSGLHDNVVKDLIAVKPKNIVYVSCNYKSFAREMVELGKIYDVVNMTAIDMFPHTPHVELVSLLTQR